MKNRIILAGLLVSVVTGCMSPPAVLDRTPPAWIEQPGDGVSASAAIHVRGRAAQEELAIARAREELAKRRGVTIDSASRIEQHYRAGRLATDSGKQISETVSGIEVRSRVQAKWLDPDTGVLWVWVVPD